MTDATTTPQPPTTPSFAMIRTLGLASTISGLLIVLVFKWTLPYREENQRRSTETAIFYVLPQAVTQLSFTLTTDGLKPTSPGLSGEVIYATYDAKGTLLGLALPGAGQGYADQIKVLYAYNPNCKCINKVKVLKMADTPGLGDRITTDPKFLENFNALDANLNSNGTELAHPIVAVKHGTKTQPWQIDAISGATISSRGMAKALNSSANRLLPQIHKQLALLQAAGLETVNATTHSNNTTGK